MKSDESPMDVSASTTHATNITQDLKHCSCGFLMGTADIVPGVSGGTMALIVGVYERLITAISRTDIRFVRHLMAGQFRDAAERIDLRFLSALGCGILVGAGGLASVMKSLLTDHRTMTYAAFSGMILASSLLVARRVRVWNQMQVGLMLLAGVFACWLVTRPALQNPPDSHWYLFLCGVIGITAMILPGISGAFILLLLSRYDTMLTAIHSVVHGEITGDVLGTIAIFAAGCACGLVSFSRVLRRLLSGWHDSTIAVLCGFMLGSLYRIWPFQKDLTPDVEDVKHKIFEHFLPQGFSGEVWAAVILGVMSGGIVLALDGLVGRAREAECRK